MPGSEMLPPPALKTRAVDLDEGGKLACFEICDSHTECFTHRLHFGLLRYNLPVINSTFLMYAMYFDKYI